MYETICMAPYPRKGRWRASGRLILYVVFFVLIDRASNPNLTSCCPNFWSMTASRKCCSLVLHHIIKRDIFGLRYLTLSPISFPPLLPAFLTRSPPPTSIWTRTSSLIHLSTILDKSISCRPRIDQIVAIIRRARPCNRLESTAVAWGLLEVCNSLTMISCALVSCSNSRKALHHTDTTPMEWTCSCHEKSSSPRHLNLDPFWISANTETLYGYLVSVYKTILVRIFSYWKQNRKSKILNLLP